MVALRALVRTREQGRGLLMSGAPSIAEFRYFYREVFEARAEEIERTDAIPRDLLEQAAELGVYRLTVPVEHGGFGLELWIICPTSRSRRTARPPGGCDAPHQRAVAPHRLVRQRGAAQAHPAHCQRRGRAGVRAHREGRRHRPRPAFGRPPRRRQLVDQRREALDHVRRPRRLVRPRRRHRYQPGQGFPDSLPDPSRHRGLRDRSRPRR